MNIKIAISTIAFGVLAATSAAHSSDLDAWRASGLAQEHAGELTPDTFSESYREKLAVYRQLIQAQGSQTSIATPVPPLTRAEVVADLAAWHAAGLQQAYAGDLMPSTLDADYRAKYARYQQLVAANDAQTSIAQTPVPPLTRAEVLADLTAWRAAGLEQAHAGELTPDTLSASYRAKYARYQRLIGHAAFATPA